MAFLYDIEPPTSMLSPLTNANTMTGDLFGSFLIMFVFFVTFMGLKAYKTEKAVLPAAIISFISTVLLVPTGIVRPYMIVITIGLVIAGIFYNH